MQLTVNENWFSSYHDYVVRSTIQSENIQARYLARITSETALIKASGAFC